MPETGSPTSRRHARRHNSSRAAALFAVVVGLATVGLVAPSGAAALAAGTVVATGQVVALPAAEVVSVPGRTLPDAVAGYGFVAKVADGFVAHAGSGASELSAAPGDQLEVMSVVIVTFAPAFGDPTAGGTPPDVALHGAGQTIPLAPTAIPGGASASGGSQFAGWWAIGVPTGAPVSLSMTEADYTQTLDLRTGFRIGPAPRVFYRNADPAVLDVSANETETIVATAAGNQVAFPLTLSEAALSYFTPADTEAAATAPLVPGQAYLEVNLGGAAGTDPAGDTYSPDSPIPPGHVTVQLGDGPSVAATGGATSAVPGLVDGLYSFVVPADTTSASVVISPPAGMTAVDDSADGTSSDVPLAFAAPARFTVSFPPPEPTASGTPGAASRPGAGHSTASVGGRTRSAGAHAASSGGSRSGGGGGGPTLATAAGAGGGTLVVLIGVGLFIERRTRRAVPRPVSASDDDVLAPLPSEAPEPAGTTEAAATTEHADGGVEETGDGQVAASATGEVLGEPGMAAADVRDRVVVADVQPADPRAVRADRRLVLGVLGPLEVEGLRSTIRRKPVLWTLILLAISEGKPISVDELRNRLASAEDKEPSAPSVRTYVSYLRAALPEGMLPDKGTDAGYLLPGDDIEVDWDTFRALAERARRVEGEDRLELAGRALALIRGPVLAHKTWHGVDQAVYHMTVAISDLAAQSAAEALRIGRPDLAEQAGRQGLRGAPGTPKLWQARIDAAKAGSGESVAGIVAQALADLGPAGEAFLDI